MSLLQPMPGGQVVPGGNKAAGGRLTISNRFLQIPVPVPIIDRDYTAPPSAAAAAKGVLGQNESNKGTFETSAFESNDTKDKRERIKANFENNDLIPKIIADYMIRDMVGDLPVIRPLKRTAASAAIRQDIINRRIIDADQIDPLVLKSCVDENVKDLTDSKAPINTVLIEEPESEFLPAPAVSTPLTALLQIIRNNLKHLFNNKENLSNKKPNLTLAGNDNVDNNTYPTTKAVKTELDTKAPINAALADEAESTVLPATTSTPTATLLQTIRNNLKWLFNNRAAINITLTDEMGATALPPVATSTLLTILLQTIRNNLKWLFNNNYTKTEIDTKLNDKAPINATLADNAESNTLPATTSTPTATLLQTIRNNLKWLFNNRAAINITLTDETGATALPATTSTSITTLLQTIRNNLKWLFNNNYTKTEIDTKLDGKAPINVTLADNAESNTLPATTSTPTATLLQTIRNNLKWLFNKKQNKIDYADFNGTGTPGQNQTIYKKSSGIEWIKKSSLGAGKYYVKFNRDASNIRIVGSATTNTDYQNETYYDSILHFMQGRYDSSDDTVCISVCNKDGVQTDAAIIKICAFDT